MTDAENRRPRTSDDSSIRLAGRIVADVVILSLWVVLLTLFVLDAAWPGWLFYALLFGGVGLYVLLTPPWR